MDQVNEGDDHKIDVSFFDDDGNAVIPSAAVVRIDDDSTGTVMRAPAVVSSLAATITVAITPTENRILDAGSYSEERIVTVAFTYTDDGGITRSKNVESRYQVINLRGIGSGVPTTLGVSTELAVTLTAGGRLPITSGIETYIVSAASNVTIAGLASGLENGQFIVLIRGGSYSITIPSGTSAKTDQPRGTITLDSANSIGYRWNESRGLWEELFRTETPVAFRMTLGGDQSIPSKTWTKVAFGTATFGSIWVHPTAYRFTAVRSGIYRFSTQIFVYGAAAGSYWYASFYKNGTSYKKTRKVFASDEGEFCIELDALIQMSASDYIEVYVYQDTLGSVNLVNQDPYSYFEGHSL